MFAITFRNRADLLVAAFPLAFCSTGDNMPAKARRRGVTRV
jgi:hypothetical protein